ncbi:hypothetical protein [Rhodococcus sp. 14C212]|uniref:hypothetical protein n=1 Tax=Rhodococcus sp. 14C212 TaxID=2711209 RepID=UPI0019806297|nr:hypothetical protein [Rhodococcus sp. 14C212]
MDAVIDKLFITPMSWLLAVPIVLLDRMLGPDLSRLRRTAARRSRPEPGRQRFYDHAQHF